MLEVEQVEELEELGEEKHQEHQQSSPVGTFHLVCVSESNDRVFAGFVLVEQGEVRHQNRNDKRRRRRTMEYQLKINLKNIRILLVIIVYTLLAPTPIFQGSLHVCPQKAPTALQTPTVTVGEKAVESSDWLFPAYAALLSGEVGEEVGSSAGSKGSIDRCRLRKSTPHIP